MFLEKRVVDIGVDVRMQRSAIDAIMAFQIRTAAIINPVSYGDDKR